MKKILFGITTLNFGGAERVLVDICNCLCNNYDIEILTLYANGPFAKELNKKVKVRTIMKNSFNDIAKIHRTILSLKLLFTPTRKSMYKKYVGKKYDKVIAFLEGGITTLFSCDKNIAWIHNDIQLVFGKSFASKIKKIFNKSIYKKYKELVFVSNHNMQKFNEFYDIDVKKQVIYNYVDKNLIIKKSNDKIDLRLDKNCISFLSVARLVEQKAIDRLIVVHKKLIDNGNYHNIYIVGDGPKRLKLEKLIKDNNVEKTFHLLGAKSNPYPYIKACDVFCLLSYYEGLPIVLIEAMTLNKNIFITDTASREALENYDSKIIANNDEKGIYETFIEIINNKKKFVSNNNTKDMNEESMKKIVDIMEEL